MRLQQVATTWTRSINTILVVKLVGLDINHIVVTKTWSKWITFLLVVISLLYDSEGKEKT
jgi:hypothetical protein